MAHAVSLRPVIAEARFFPWDRPCRICGELSDSWDRFLSKSFGFTLPALSAYLHRNIPVIGTSGRSPEPSSSALSDIGQQGTGRWFTLSLFTGYCSWLVG